MGICRLSGKLDEMLGLTLQWNGIPFRGSGNTPSHFMSQIQE